MTVSHISWERIRELRQAGVLADLHPRSLFCVDRPILVVCCCDERLLRGRLEFQWGLGLCVAAIAVVGGILGCDAKRTDPEDLAANLRVIRRAVEKTQAAGILAMADTPCREADGRAYDADELIASALDGTMDLRAHLREYGFTGIMEPAIHACWHETARERTYRIARLKHARLEGSILTAAASSGDSSRMSIR